jgi:hypothetical protein
VVASLALGAAITGVFFLWENMLAPDGLLSQKLPRQKAMIPWDIISNRDILLLFYSEAVSGMGMYAVRFIWHQGLILMLIGKGPLLLQHILHLGQRL